jgi:phycocyanin beta chain
MPATISEILEQPTSAGRYLSAGEMDLLIEKFLHNATDRLTVAKLLQSQSTELVSTSLRTLLEDKPSLIGSGGPLNDHNKLAEYIRELDIFLRFISYSTVAGDTGPLVTNWLHDIRSRYAHMGLSIGLIASAVRLLQSQTLSEIDQLSVTNNTKKLVNDCFINIIVKLT